MKTIAPDNATTMVPSDTLPRFGEVTAQKIAAETGKPFFSARNKFAALSAHDELVNASAAMRTLAGALMKIANDVRFYACGPRAGFGELKNPGERARLLDHAGQDQPDAVRGAHHGRRAGVRQRPRGGVCRLARQLPAQRLQADHAAQRARVAQLLAEGITSFNAHCANGIEPNVKRIRQHLENSLMLVTALNPHIGYEKAAQISLLAYREDVSLREAALKLGYLTAEQFDAWVRPEDMTHPMAG